MRKSSVHFRPLKTTSENHNFRRVNLDYNFKYFEKNNESFSYDKRKLNSIKKAVTKHIERKTGRKVRSTATPIKEGVVVLESHHNIEDLKALCNAYKKQLGITPLQIHIHKDEGKDPSDLNYHAHIVGVFYNLETGKSLRLSKADMQKMQDITSEVLGMERGISKEKSNRKHLESKLYAERQQHLKLQEALKEIERLTSEVELKKNTEVREVTCDIETLEEKEKLLTENIIRIRRRRKELKERDWTLKRDITIKNYEDTGGIREEYNKISERIRVLTENKEIVEKICEDRHRVALDKNNNARGKYDRIAREITTLEKQIS